MRAELSSLKLCRMQPDLCKKIMLKRFSNEQLEKLLIHTVGINSVLTEVLLEQAEREDEETEVIGSNAHIDILVIDPASLLKKEVKEAKK
jgi:hypothetical protein